MSTNGVNSVEETDMMECDGEKVVTMMDVLQEQQDFEDDANAVLGASDDKECTYSKGYIKRQALYACLTCCSGAKDDPSQRAGVCLACSLNCHENHELIELYTKRNFRCDCGNPKFKSHPCQFTPNKTDLNEDNNYNQNFSGIYCICNRPYPDPEASVEEDMIQCIICEDWLHSTHLEAVVPAHDLYAEMICKACMEKNEFLHDYTQIAVNYEADVDITTTNENDNSKSIENSQLFNGTMNSSAIPDIEMANDPISEQKDNNSSDEVTHVISNEDNEIKSTEETKENCTSANSEKQQADESDSIVPTNNELPTCNGSSPVELEQNSKLDDHLQDKREKENDETSIIHSIEPTVGTQDTTENKSDDNKELEKANLEDNEDSIKEISEDVSKPKETEQENINATNDSSTSSTEISETNKTLDNISKDGDINKLNDTFSATNEEKMQPSEEKDLSERAENASESMTENKPVEENKKETNNCAADSLEAATKELSELMDEGETNQSSNDSQIDKTNELLPTPTSDSKTEVKANGLKEEKIHNTEIRPIDDDSQVPDNIENDNKRKLNDSTDEVFMKKQKVDSSENCLRPKNVKRALKGATFWPSNFRQKLCTCNNCLSMYKDLNVLFLTDIEDTVTAYEVLGKEINDGGPATQYEKGLQALSSLDRVQQINALTEYNKMRDKLLDFLKSFKDRKEVVKEEDIKAFFAGMKPRREPDGVYFCR